MRISIIAIALALLMCAPAYAQPKTEGEILKNLRESKSRIEQVLAELNQQRIKYQRDYLKVLGAIEVLESLRRQEIEKAIEEKSGE